jgi:ankyrin repeat protein
MHQTSPQNSDAEANFRQALKNENFDAAILLLRTGTNPDCLDKDGRTALMLAAMNCQLKSIQFLLQATDIELQSGVKVLSSTNVRTLVQQAWETCPLEICDYVGNFVPSIDPNIVDNHQLSALAYVMLAPWKHTYGSDYESYKSEAIKLLIAAGADVNVTIKCIDNGRPELSTPLIEATLAEEQNIVDLLVQANANPFAQKNGKTALALAEQKRKNSILKAGDPEVLYRENPSLRHICKILLAAQKKWTTQHPDQDE